VITNFGNRSFLAVMALYVHTLKECSVLCYLGHLQFAKIYLSDTFPALIHTTMYFVDGMG